MGILTAIKTGVKAVFGVSTTKGVDNVMEVARGVGGWIDEQQYTQEEKAVAGAARLSALTDYLKSVADENTERSITRRVLAMYIIRAELVMLFLSAAAYKLDPDMARYLYQIATDSPLGLLTLGVGAFFWGTHLLRAAGK